MKHRSSQNSAPQPIRLSDHFSCKRLMRFTFPAITMMVFTSIYGVADGFFVSNFAGKSALGAITLMFPFLGILGAVGFMLGSGGAALVGRLLGEGRRDEANSRFSLFLVTCFLGGIALGLCGEAAARPVAFLLGARGDMLACGIVYARIALLGLPFFMLQNLFQTFFATAEKPKLGLAVTVLAGCTNMALDALFVAAFHWGLAGAAVATAISEMVGGALPFWYFARPNSSLLRLIRPQFSGRALLKACGNGFSEFLGSTAFSALTILYNFQLLRLSGENGVAAFGVLLYVTFIFAMIFHGYALGSAPLVSYNYGAGNRAELSNVFKKSLIINSCAGLILSLSAALFAPLLAQTYVSYDRELLRLTTHAIRLFAPVFLFCWANIYGASFFTALNNGVISAAISFLRTLVCGVAAILVLPAILGLNGVWLAWSAAEFCCLLATLSFFLLMRGKYGYA